MTEISTKKVYRSQDRGSLSASNYKVKKGDTLYSIAFASGQDYRQLARNNQLSPPYVIRPGQVIQLRGSAPKPAVSSKNSNSSNASSNSRISQKSQQKQQIASNSSAPKASSEKTKKDLDKPVTQEYVVTGSQQNINQVIHKTDPRAASQKVSAWIWPAKGKLVGRYTSSEQGGNGIKVSAPRGTAVLASADGRVVYAGSALRGYGNLIIIKHNDDYLSAYAHNDRILVKDRQTVRQGQRIADMGSSGTNQVVLHFEIRFRGQSVNPLNFLPKS
ncbi:peptidase M23 [Paraferrimonas sedimenticola]|uniref:Peptidase M23 n=1 Tax=Paraferrimonas sedimenticola TaxID=375674 RepID=A0AA37RY39_9GAMM|nr:peptidase M23 [Paraferrimonas sedimenticola]